MCVEEADAEIDKGAACPRGRGVCCRVVIVVGDDGDGEGGRGGGGVFLKEVKIGQGVGEGGFDKGIARCVAVEASLVSQ